MSPLGSRSNGTQAWFQLGSFQLQPSEFAKITLIVAFAAFAAGAGGHLDRRKLGIALGIALVPTGLILMQPDLGSALVLAAITMGTLLVAGTKPRHIVVLTLLGLVSVAAILQTDTLKQYQRDRLTAFVEQAGEPAYQQTQSKTAIGSGGLTGQGYLEGTQTNLGYVPEQHTDFIFTVVGEELGFAGRRGGSVPLRRPRMADLEDRHARRATCSACSSAPARSRWSCSRSSRTWG